MKGFDVLKVKSAVKSHNKFDLSKTHLTTLNFGEIMPMYVEETVPGDKFNISADYFSRMAPLAKPTYGKFSFKTVAAFVPYYMVAEDSDAWLAGKTQWEGKTPVQRYFTVGTWHQFIVDECTVSASTTDYDYYFIDSAGTPTYRKFTTAGKYRVKVMNALGYALPQGVDLQGGSQWNVKLNSSRLSALPLLAFAKLYNDYMTQSQRYNSSQLSSLLQDIKFNKAVSYIYGTTGQLQSLGLAAIFNNIRLNYENDYFTSAWQNPNAALNGLESLTGFTVPSNGAMSLGQVYGNTNDNALWAATGTTEIKIGQRALDFLKSFDDWVRRNNYSGSRAVQQIYSRFGIKTDDYKSHYAQVLSTDSMPVQVGDVTAVADSTGAPLGDYAGKGIMSGGKNVSVQCSDYGLVLILGYFTVTPMNAYGFDRRVLRNSPLDYFNPEFDGLGADAISVGEYFTNAHSTDSGTPLDNAVFGFTERYNAYRYGRDMITGDFRDQKNTVGMNVWHTGRDLTTLRDSGNLVAQSSSVNTLPQIDSEYNRIFSITSGDVDHFYVTARFNVDAIRPMLSLNQVPRLGEGDTTVPRNGNVIS